MQPQEALLLSPDCGNSKLTSNTTAAALPDASGIVVGVPFAAAAAVAVVIDTAAIAGAVTSATAPASLLLFALLRLRMLHMEINEQLL